VVLLLELVLAQERVCSVRAVVPFLLAQVLVSEQDVAQVQEHSVEELALALVCLVAVHLAVACELVVVHVVLLLVQPVFLQDELAQELVHFEYHLVFFPMLVQLDVCQLVAQLVGAFQVLSVLVPLDVVVYVRPDSRSALD
jgi:hypothetical protein